LAEGRLPFEVLFCPKHFPFLRNALEPQLGLILKDALEAGGSGPSKELPNILRHFVTKFFATCPSEPAQPDKHLWQDVERFCPELLLALHIFSREWRAGP
jgi:hypothetical protein